MAGGGSPWCCWCASYREDDEEEWKRRKREQLLDCLRQVKGLSPASHLVLQTDAAYILDDVEQKLFGDIYCYLCGSKCGAGGFGNSFCLLVWLGLYAAVMLTLQFKLYKLLDSTLLPKVWDGASSWLRVIEQDYVTEFHVYYSVSVALMIIVMSSAFLSARRALMNFTHKSNRCKDFLAALNKTYAPASIFADMPFPLFNQFRCKELQDVHVYGMTRELIKIAQVEMRTDIRDSIDYDFYAFVNRLPKYFSVSPDLTKAAIRRIHRLLHTDLDTRICMMDYDVKGPLSVEREVQQRIASRICCFSFFSFFLPWFATIVANACLIVKIFAVTYGQQREVQVQKPDVLTTGDFGPTFRDEGTHFIGYALLVNLVAWLYLAVIQLHCVTFTILHSLYTRACVGIVVYCDRVLLRIWDEAVLNNIADYIEDIKKNVEFSEERVRIPFTQQMRYEAAHPLDSRCPSPEIHHEGVMATSATPVQAPPSPAAKRVEEPVFTAAAVQRPTSVYSFESSASEGNRSTLIEPLFLGRKSLWRH